MAKPEARERILHACRAVKDRVVGTSPPASAWPVCDVAGLHFPGGGKLRLPLPAPRGRSCGHAHVRHGKVSRHTVLQQTGGEACCLTTYVTSWHNAIITKDRPRNKVQTENRGRQSAHDFYVQTTRKASPLEYKKIKPNPIYNERTHGNINNSIECHLV